MTARSTRKTRPIEADDGEAPLWQPYPDSPQSRATESLADITGYGGAAGGGKTDWLLGIAITRHRNSIIFRREFTNLKGLVDRSRDIVGSRGRFNGQDYTWRSIPGDRKIEFGAVKDEDSKRKYQGRPHDFIGFDELPHFEESQFWFLLGWLRTTIPGQRCRVGVTFNPPTRSSERWVLKMFAPWLDRRHHNPAMPGELRWYARIGGEDIERPDGEPFEHEGETIKPLSRTFFPARLIDNPALAATGYGAQLQSLPEPLRSQLLYGDFDASVEDDPWQVIPTAWVEAANERWMQRGGDGYRPSIRMTCVGMDVAHGGKDQTILAPRWSDWVGRLVKYPGSQTPDGKSAAALAVKDHQPGAQINVDAIGWGASAAEKLADRPHEGGYGLPAIAVNVANGSDFTDKSGKYKMRNLRAEIYWRLREALDPDNDSTLCLPPDSELLADLVAPTYEITIGGIKIESKDDIKDRLGRSPDCGDAVALTMIEPKPYCPAMVGGPDRHLPSTPARRQDGPNQPGVSGQRTTVPASIPPRPSQRPGFPGQPMGGRPVPRDPYRR